MRAAVNHKLFIQFRMCACMKNGCCFQNLFAIQIHVNWLETVAWAQKRLCTHAYSFKWKLANWRDHKSINDSELQQCCTVLSGSDNDNRTNCVYWIMHTIMVHVVVHSFCNRCNILMIRWLFCFRRTIQWKKHSLMNYAHTHTYTPPCSRNMKWNQISFCLRMRDHPFDALTMKKNRPTHLCTLASYTKVKRERNEQTVTERLNTKSDAISSHGNVENVPLS